jgi:hypothetical protein
MMTLQQIKADQQMIMQQFGVTNPVCGIMEYLNTISDMLDLANIKNVGRYFKTPSPQVLQQIAATPKEPDAQTVAAKAQFEKVKSETARALAEQQFKQQKQDQDDAFRRSKLAQETVYDAAKLQLEQEQIRRQHDAALGGIAADMFKVQSQAAAAAAKADAQGQGQ